MNTPERHEGSCCCGQVRFTVDGPFGPMTHCHCTDCRKTHGAAFGTFLEASRARFLYVRGEAEIGGFTTVTGTRRSFCRRCGSTLLCTVAGEPEAVFVAAATLDTTLRQRPEYHIFVRSQVPWLDLNDGLPRYREFRD